MGSLKSPWTSCRSSTETIALNCLLFLESRVLCTHFATDGQTDGQRNEQHRSVKALLAVASGALIICKFFVSSTLLFVLFLGVHFPLCE